MNNTSPLLQNLFNYVFHFQTCAIFQPIWTWCHHILLQVWTWAHFQGWGWLCVLHTPRGSLLPTSHMRFLWDLHWLRQVYFTNVHFIIIFREGCCIGHSFLLVPPFEDFWDIGDQVASRRQVEIIWTSKRSPSSPLREEAIHIYKPLHLKDYSSDLARMSARSVNGMLN